MMQAETSSHSVALLPQEKPSSHTWELLKQAASVSPNDIFVAICFFMAARYMSILPDLDADDAASVGTICAIAHTAARVIGSSHQLATLFTIEGINIRETNNVISTEIDRNTLQASLVQLIKIGLVSSTIAAAFLLSIPSLYKSLGTPENVIQVSQDYVNIAALSLYPQILNVGFQQTLLKMGKKTRLLQGAFLNFSITMGSLLIFMHLIGPLSTIQNIALSFVIGGWISSAFYCLYLMRREYWPTLAQFAQYLLKDTDTKVGRRLFMSGNDIAIQLMSELLAVNIMSFNAAWFLPSKYLTQYFSILNAASTINFTAVVPAITFAQASSNLIDSLVKLRKAHPEEEKHLAGIRDVAYTALRVCLIYNAILAVIVTGLAPVINSLFYKLNDIDMPGISSNAYLINLIVTTGLLINSRRDLCLFMLRSLGIFELSSKSSILALWLVNYPALVFFSKAVPQLELYICAILIAYYWVGVSVGERILRHKLEVAIDLDNLNILLGPQTKEQRKLKESINQVSYYKIPLIMWQKTPENPDESVGHSTYNPLLIQVANNA